VQRRLIAASPLHGRWAAVSVGIVGGVPVLDLDYAEDSQAETDMNVVMNNGRVRGDPGDRRGPTRSAATSSMRCSISRRTASASCSRCRLRRSRAVTRVVLASGNPGKLREFAALLASFRFELVPQSEFGIHPATESGTTFIENALLKARHAARHARLPALADDSGIEVEALGGPPRGVVGALCRRGRE